MSCRLFFGGRIAKSLFESLDHLFIDFFVRSIIEASLPGLPKHVSVRTTENKPKIQNLLIEAQEGGSTNPMRSLFRPAGIAERVIALKAFPSLEVGTFTFTAKGLCRRCGRFREKPRVWQSIWLLIVFRKLEESELRILTRLHVEE